jgi:N-acetylmuramoyl-L-alanine amidase
MKGDWIMPKVILDAGHGGNDTGDIYQNRMEKNDNLKLALEIGDILRNEYGYDVVYTRTEDEYLSQLDRVRIANEEGGDLIVSIHRIAGDLPSAVAGLGFSIGEYGGLAEEAANHIGNEMTSVGFPNYYIDLRTDLPIFRDVSIPAVMIGVGYLNSWHDNELFDTRLSEIAEAIAKGIVDTLSPQQEAEELIHSFTERKEQNKGRRRAFAQDMENYHIRVGRFTVYSDAMDYQMGLIRKGYPAVVCKDGSFYSVFVGGAHDLDTAAILEYTLRREGYNTLVIRL